MENVKQKRLWDPKQHLDVDKRFEQMMSEAQKCPVAYTEAHGGTWTVLKYDLLKQVAKEPSIFTNGGRPRFGRGLPPLEVDPPEHGFYRRLVQDFFMPKYMKKLEPKIQAAANDLVQKVVAKGTVDLAEELSYPMPVMGLCALLDISHENWEQIKQWSLDSLHTDATDPKVLALAYEGHEKLLAHARAMVADRRSNPRDPKEDLTSALLSAEYNGEPIDNDRIAGTLRLIISAGHNSTTNGLGNALLYLAENETMQEELRQNLNAIPLFIEELLRLQTPVQEMPRIASQDVELSGCPIKAGERIGMFWAAGNRDPEAFADPDIPVFGRKPNRHLAFGHGIHSCLGAPLARMEIRLTLEAMLTKTKSFKVAGAVTRPRYHHMGVTSLPVRIGA